MSPMSRYVGSNGWSKQRALAFRARVALGFGAACEPRGVGIKNDEAVRPIGVGDGVLGASRVVSGEY
jgi:hypothetical protein